MEDNVEFNFKNNFIINNDQGLEEEELEDRKRREEEIHSLLTKAMGSCSLTDDSSLNSSSHTAIETTSDVPPIPSDDIEKQYLESNVDDQLKVLYEIRTREVKELSNQLEKIKLELQEQQRISKTKIALLDLENERKNISLQEAQNLLVEKAEQINERNKQLENLKSMVKCLEGNLAEVNDEKEILRQLNLSLEQQIHLMEKNGFPLMNKSSDRDLRESLNSKIRQLEQSLESALKQNEQRVKQHSDLVHGLKQTIQEKDDYLAEKGFLINKLTENFEVAQSQCQELMKTVAELREIQNNKSQSVIQISPLEIGMRKLREDREKTKMYDEVREIVTEEFQAQVNTLNAENKMLLEKLDSQEKQLNRLIQREEIISIIEKEKEVLQHNLQGLEKQLQCTLVENKKLQEDCAKRLQNFDSSLQTSFPTIDVHEFENIKQDNEKAAQELASAQLYISNLQTQFTQLQEECSHLKVKADLEQERDVLIAELKEKALNFEKLIIEKQQDYLKQQSKRASIGVNTEQQDNEDCNSILKLKYDSLLFQREANLRNQLQEEFDARLEGLRAKSKLQTDCMDCGRLKTEINEINEQRRQDKVAVLKMIDIWQNKFQEVGVASDNQFDRRLVDIDKEYTEKFKMLAQMLQEQFVKEVKQQETKLSQTNERVNRINIGISKIIAKIQQGDSEVNQINRQLKLKIDSKRKKKVQGTENIPSII